MKEAIEGIKTPKRMISKIIAASLLGGALYSPVSFAQLSTSVVLEEIIVTARKRQESLQDVPIAITCLLYTSPSPRDRG